MRFVLFVCAIPSCTEVHLHICIALRLNNHLSKRLFFVFFFKFVLLKKKTEKVNAVALFFPYEKDPF